MSGRRAAVLNIKIMISNRDVPRLVDRVGIPGAHGKLLDLEPLARDQGGDAVNEL